MKPQETKFTFVYNEIKQCILEGQIPPGHALPSSRMLCNQFHVSRYTVNRVFDALREEGLVHIRPRLAPTVAIRKDASDPSGAVADILKQREGILQVYRTFALILPSLLVFSLQGCDVEIMPHYKQAMKVLRLGNRAGGWRPPSKLGYDILRIGGNSLFGELYSTFGLYNKLAFFTEDCPCFAKYFLEGSASITGVIIDILKGEDSLAKYSQLSNMYQELAGAIERMLNYLSDTTADCPAQTGISFSWNPMRGQDYHYSKIVDDMNLKIGLGEYSVGMYLPYEKQLAVRYDVSLSTVRKALSELEQRGFVKTINGKGTVVIEPDVTKLHQLSLNSGYVEKALRYFHALQLMVLIIRPAALAAAPRFTREELDRLAGRFSSGSIYLADMLEAIMEHTTLKPLYVILYETNHLLEWGHHFAYYPSKKHTLSHLNRKVILALQQLREGDAGAFADSMADCYRYNLICMKKHMAEKYKLHHVANIRVPEKY